jgi:hypothetical protein
MDKTLDHKVKSQSKLLRKGAEAIIISALLLSPASTHSDISTKETNSQRCAQPTDLTNRITFTGGYLERGPCVLAPIKGVKVTDDANEMVNHQYLRFSLNDKYDRLNYLVIKEKDFVLGEDLKFELAFYKAKSEKFDSVDPVTSDETKKLLENKGLVGALLIGFDGLRRNINPPVRSEHPIDLSKRP